MKNNLRIVVTGEVDAGKSTLIGRFLYDMDSLPTGAIEETRELCRRLGRDLEFAYLLDSFEEERAGELTIDTTQVFYRNKRGGGFIFIDVPGHKELIKNMLTGSSYADIAVLVIDVRKSLEEQTRRHASILKLMGIEQVIVALNKMDTVEFRENIFTEVRENTIRFLAHIGIETKSFIPVSAKSGENIACRSKKMAWYTGVPLRQALDGCFRQEVRGDFRFPIQDIYQLGRERAAVGEIISGGIKKGERVRVLPLDKECTVRAIKGFKKDLAAAGYPQSVGLVIDGAESLQRGQIVCKERLPKVETAIPARIFCVQPLSTEAILQFECTTQDTPARIGEITGVWDTADMTPASRSGSLRETDFAEAVIMTEHPMVVERFAGSNGLGRFVLKDDGVICAIGVVR
jgi:small GTP-binding protein